MKKVLFLLIFPLFVFGQYTSIPDSLFEQKLINLGYDNVHDGQVLTVNIVNVDSLNLDAGSSGLFGAPTNQISDLTGIEDFINLVYLNCSRNSITSLDLTQNTSLTYLDCSGWYSGFVQSVRGKISNLNLSQNTALTNLICPLNKLTNIDLSQNTSLLELNCANNILSSLDLSQNTNLTHLNCLGYQIQNLDLTQNINLIDLNCGGNLFSNLDLTQNTSLINLNCSGVPFGIRTGPVMNLNPFNPPPIGKLMTLDLRNGNNINLINFDATNNGALHCISVDDSTFSTNNWNNIDYQTIFTNDCSIAQFVPTGYTAIPDSVFEDKLISLGYDTINDGKVLTTNISNIDSLDISSGYIFDGIYNLSGIEDFTNLTYLECRRNPLITIDVSQNSQLTHLIYQGQAGMGGTFSNLINLVLPQSNNLIHLECPFNILESLDISQNSSLQYLDCSFNNSMFGGLDSVNLTQNLNLEFINLMATGIDKLDVSQNNLLKKLYCHNLIGAPSSFSSSQNSIENLNLSNNSNIDTILCGGNKLTNLDISQNTSLIFLSCKDNVLRNLDLRNGNNINFTGFDATNNDSLYCISVDDSTWSVNNWTDIDSHTSFSNDCNPSTVDIIEIEKNLSVYPNPTSEEITISINNFNGNIQTEVYDLIGNILQLTNKTTISLRDYARGIYILNVAYGDRVEEVKVIKE